MSLAVVAFRSSRVTDMYLIVDALERLNRVPAALLERFGAPVEVLSFELSGDRLLARARASEVLDAIASKGFYLQLPPSPEESIHVR